MSLARDKSKKALAEFLRYGCAMLSRDALEAIVRRALDEDLPDITSEAIFEPGDRGRARFLMKASGILAGLAFAQRTFAAIDPSASFTDKRKDGDKVEAGDVIAEVEATVVALLAGER